MALENPLQPMHKRLMILLPDENPLPAVTARHHVVNRAGILEA
jgi:hypothetical protein